MSENRLLSRGIYLSRFFFFLGFDQLFFWESCQNRDLSSLEIFSGRPATQVLDRVRKVSRGIPLGKSAVL